MPVQAAKKKTAAPKKAAPKKPAAPKKAAKQAAPKKPARAVQPVMVQRVVYVRAAPERQPGFVEALIPGLGMGLGFGLGEEAIDRMFDGGAKKTRESNKAKTHHAKKKAGPPKKR